MPSSVMPAWSAREATMRDYSWHVDVRGERPENSYILSVHWEETKKRKLKLILRWHPCHTDSQMVSDTCQRIQQIPCTNQEYQFPRRPLPLTIVLF